MPSSSSSPSARSSVAGIISNDGEYGSKHDDASRQPAPPSTSAAAPPSACQRASRPCSISPNHHAQLPITDPVADPAADGRSEQHPATIFHFPQIPGKTHHAQIPNPNGLKPISTPDLRLPSRSSDERRQICHAQQDPFSPRRPAVCHHSASTSMATIHVTPGNPSRSDHGHQQLTPITWACHELAVHPSAHRSGQQHQCPTIPIPKQSHGLAHGQDDGIQRSSHPKSCQKQHLAAHHHSYRRRQQRFGAGAAGGARPK
ncbi:hypothetical protein ACLOJK_034400 [Asimina triloba]